jgi:predicted nucleotidyltransferase
MRMHPEVLLEAAAPILTTLAAENGYSRLAVFGSVARHDARGVAAVMDRQAAKELLRIQGWLERVDEVIQRGRGACPADALLSGGPAIR